MQTCKKPETELIQAAQLSLSSYTPFSSAGLQMPQPHPLPGPSSPSQLQGEQARGEMDPPPPWVPSGRVCTVDVGEKPLRWGLFSPHGSSGLQTTQSCPTCQLQWVGWGGVGEWTPAMVPQLVSAWCGEALEAGKGVMMGHSQPGRATLWGRKPPPPGLPPPLLCRHQLGGQRQNRRSLPLLPTCPLPCG